MPTDAINAYILIIFTPYIPFIAGAVLGISLLLAAYTITRDILAKKDFTP